MSELLSMYLMQSSSIGIRRQRTFEHRPGRMTDPTVECPSHLRSSAVRRLAQYIENSGFCEDQLRLRPSLRSFSRMVRPLSPLSALAATSFLAMLCGCSVLNLQNLTGNGAKSGTDFTGNYGIAGVPNTSGQAPGPVQGFVGAVANTGTAFTATFRLASASGCVAPTADVLFTGSMDSSGQITLTSTTLPNNPISITWLDDPTQSSNGIGTYTISGSGPCAMAATQFVSDGFSPVTGTYTGTFTSTTGTQATVTASLTQGAANADGEFQSRGL